MQRDQGGLYQCLLHLRAADGRIMHASEFLPAVEQTAKILKLDRWVIIKALVTLHKLHKQHKNREQTPRLMISQSASALKDLQRIEWIEESLAKTGIKGRAMVLEFPFPEVTADPQGARDYLASLRQLGIGISLNCTRELDALLQDLNLLPAHYIKITEKQIHNYPDTWSQLVKAAHKLGKRVIVSRIEHPELLGQLWSSDVDYIQGNFVQPPGTELDYDFAGSVLM
jgi:EAL domain-containing protein (putative c-di-GMP-specific phosphodiesterase class I)